MVGYDIDSELQWQTTLSQPQPQLESLALAELQESQMNTAEQIYQNVQKFPEPLAFEVLHFVEFLKSKNLSVDDLALERKIQQGIEQAENGLGVTLDDGYVEHLNQRIQQRLAANQKN